MVGPCWKEETKSYPIEGFQFFIILIIITVAVHAEHEMLEDYQEPYFWRLLLLLYYYYYYYYLLLMYSTSRDVNLNQRRDLQCRHCLGVRVNINADR